MKACKFRLHTILAVLVGTVLLAAMLVRAYVPAAIIPQWSIPNLVLVSLLTLLTDHYLGGSTKRSFAFDLLFLALAFWLLSWAGGFVNMTGALQLAIIGGIVFVLTARLFASMMERLESGPKFRGSVIISALVLFLAAQCFCGILL